MHGLPNLKVRITDFNNAATSTINSIFCRPFTVPAALRLFSKMPSFRFRTFKNSFFFFNSRLVDVAVWVCEV